MSSGPIGGAVEVTHADAGFLLSGREVYLAIQQREDFHPCRGQVGGSVFPYVLPLIASDGDGPRDLPEGFSFCARARRCGFSVVADPRVRPRPIVAQAIGWEEGFR